MYTFREDLHYFYQKTHQMEARKNTRNFSQFSGKNVMKSSLDGSRESVIPDEVYPKAYDSEKKRASKIRALYDNYGARQGERLSGVDLLNVMVPSESLKSRVKKSIPSSKQLLQRLINAEKQAASAAGESRQSQLFDQYASVLQAVSRKYPILLLLDDLQWADSVSINLLFHLARSLAGCRVLLAAAYRPEEIALGRGEERHPLEPVLGELKREFGQIWVNLNESEGEAFVREFLESEPNRLSAAFCRKLLEHTGGQALFTVESLRNL